MKRLVILLILAALTVSACTRIKVVGANFPSLFSDQVGVYDVKYGKEEWQKLDVYKPFNDNAKNPVIVFFYGGRWQYGSKNDYRFAADAFTERGYVVVVADYVKYPQGKFPMFIEDGAKAVAWVRENIWRYNGDSKNINIVGHSAGAYIGAMLATDEKYLKKEGGNYKWINSFIGLAGPYELRFTEEYKEEFDPIFDNPKDYGAICVPTYVSKNTPPMLLLRGDKDDRVDSHHAEVLVSAVNGSGGRVSTKTYENIDHVGIVAALSQIRRDRAPVAKDIDDFIKATNH